MSLSRSVPITSARPPSLITLTDWPAKFSRMKAARIERGTARAMTSVARRFPRDKSTMRQAIRHHQALLLQGMDGLSDIERLIEEDFDGEITGQPDEFGNGFFDAVHHRDRVGAGLLDNRQVHGPLAVHADHIALNHRGIHGLAHVPETDRDAVLTLIGISFM